jgi:hypothetical protein
VVLKCEWFAIAFSVRYGVGTGLNEVAKMIEPRRTGDLLLHSVARVLTYVAMTAPA